MTAARKPVEQVFVNETNELVHLTVDGKEIVTTETHPFYVKNSGFVNAGELAVGDCLLDVNGNVLLADDFQAEYTDEPTTVYNFQVEDFHTYYVGEHCVWVHNAEYDGVRIINKKYAGKTYKLKGDLAKKYPDGVKFSEDGFANFEPYSIKTVTVDDLVGDTYYDFIKANEAAGYSSTPTGYTWHHVEDGRTLMLVPSDLHGAVRHTGGAVLIRRGIRP